MRRATRSVRFVPGQAYSPARWKTGQVSRVLVVEPSDAVRTSVVSALRSQGHLAMGLPDGSALERAIIAGRPDLVVLDADLPRNRDGLDLLTVVRRTCWAGVLATSVRDEPTDRTPGSAHADDHLRKPFAMVEFLSRCEAILRRTGSRSATVTVADLTVSEDGASVRRHGVPVDLTLTERRLLVQLARHPETVVSKGQLLAAVWGYDGYDENIVEVHISSLRRRLEAHGPRVIHTVRGQGYRLGEP